MADNVAQSIKDLQKDLAALDKQLLSNNANWDKLGQTIVDSLKRGGLGLDDLFSQMKSQKDVLKLRAIIDRDALMDDVKKLQTVVDKGVKSVKIGGVEITGQRQIEQALEGYKAQLKLVPKTLAEAYDYAVKIANTLGSGNSSKASKEWLERTALNTKEKKALDDATNGYIKQTQAIQDLNRTLDELKQKRATAEALPVTGVGKSGISYKTDASKQSALGKIDKEIEATETKINNATTAAQKFKAQLIAMQGEKKTKAMSRALGVEEAEAEVQKIPTVFDRVIAQINQRAAQSKDKFAKQLVNAEGLRNEAKNAAAEVSHELNYIWRGSQSHLLAAWRNNTGYLTDFGRQDAVNQIRLSQEYKSNLDALKTQEVRDKLTQALTRYKDALQAVITLEEQQRRSASQYSAQERAVEGVTRRFNENEQAIARVRDRWDELNVKRQAGLVNEKDFKANSQKLLDEYDRLIAKRKEFETADIGQSLSERLRKQQEEEKRLEADRVRSAKETSKIITEERGKQALSSLIGSPKMNAAVQQQLKYMQQIRSIGKDINALQSNKNRSAEENALLEKRKKELRDVLELQKRLNNEQKGSANLARQIDKYNQLRGKVKETTDEVKRQKTSLESMLPTLRRLASAFGVAFSVQGLVQFGKKLVETRGEFELQQVALRSILQNKQLADEIWDKTMQAALQSSFTAMQLTKYTKQLAAYRIETDKLFDTTKRLADVSAGLGVDMQRLILAYGQVKAANYLRASEIRQFTEAGVNVLGELSDYFARTRGEIVSTAQVMDMVQKRMVKFEDVEAIFKHMTDEGGIFYNMQYIQSQTVRGQINKLHDAYDQMLNSIGQGNQGVLKNMVSIANNLVRNWREVAGTIKGIAWAFVFVQLGKVALGIHRIGDEAITSTSKVSWLARQLGKLREKTNGFEFSKIFSKANVVMAAGAAVAFVTGKFLQHLNAVRQINEKYNELSLRAYETQENLSDIQKTLSQNNQNIERLNKVSKKSKEQEEELANARKQNAEIVNRLKRDYPELADGMNIQKNGVVTLTSAISDYNEQLEYTILLNQLAKGNAWDDDFQTNVTEMTQSLQSAEQTLASYQALAKSILLQMKNMDFGFRQKGQAKGLKTLLEGIIGLDKGDYEGLNKLLSKNPLSGYNYLTKTRSWRIAFQPIYLDEHNIDATKKQLERSESVLYDMLKNSVRRDKEYMDEISKKWGGDIDKFIHNNAERIQKNVDDGKKDTFKAIREYGLQMGFAFKGAQDIFNQTLNSGNNALFGGLGFRFFEYPGVGETTTDTETPEEKQSKIDAVWRRRINLLEEMKRRYDELSKSAYGYAKSNTTVRKEFEKSWGKIFGGVLSMNAVQFTSAAEMEAAFETILAKAGAASDAVKEEIQKKGDSYGARIPIDVQVRIREDFGRQMEEAFGNYELTLDLQKLNLPKGVAAEMWGIEETDLQDLRARLTEMYNGLRDETGKLSTDAFKDYEKFLNKIDDLERKQQRERLKDYAKYLETQYSDRVKIEMEYIQKLSRLEAETAIPEAQKSAIREGLRKEFDEKSRKQDWEDFKGSEFYVEMMEDLEKQGTASLEVMRKKLLEMRANAENLSPRALKEVVNALEKIDEIERKRTQPLKRVRDAQKALEGVNMKEVYEELAINQEQLALSEEQERSMERAIMLIQKRNELEKQGYTIEEARVRLSQANQAQGFVQSALDAFKSDGSKESQDNLATLEQVLNNAKADVEKWQKIVNILSGKAVIDEQAKGNNYTTLGLSELQERRKNIKQSIKDLEGVIGKEEELAKLNKELNDAWDATYEAIKGWASSVQNVFDGVMDNVDYFTDSTYGMVSAWKEFGDTSVSALNDLVSGIQAYRRANAEAEKNNAATGLFTANGLQLALVVLGVLMKIVQAIAKQHDAALDKQIQKQQERIDALTDAYARLERQIERTWDSVSYMQTYEQQVQNIREQIDAMEAQMRAEEAKKNTDDNAVRQYQRDIQDAYDQLDELEQKSIEVFGGIGEEGYRSAAEGFVEAWKSAFLETGDGLQGLQDHFDEFLQDWFVKQATMRIAGNMLQPMFEMIDRAVDPSSNGGVAVTMQELEALRDWTGTNFPIISDTLEDLAGMFGVGGEGSLSGLAAGIQGMTEEQANILEAYWNSVRMYTASIDQNVAMIASALGVGGNSPSTNPQLQQLQLIAASVQATHQLLQSTSRSGHPMGGYGFKVFND